MKNNNTILITGASSGIGKACAEIYARHGAKLILCARREEKVKALATQLQQQYGTLSHCITIDVRKRQQVIQELTKIPDEFSMIDILINNAGLAAGLDKLIDADIDDWEQMIDTNIKGLLYVSKVIVPGMLQRNHGHIFNIGSVAGHRSYIGGSAYCGTKAAVSAITRALKLELHGTALRVTEIAPGAVETEFSMVRFKQDATKAKQVYENMKPLSAEDVANIIYFCSQQPPHVNIGQINILATGQVGMS